MRLAIQDIEFSYVGTGDSVLRQNGAGSFDERPGKLDRLEPRMLLHGEQRSVRPDSAAGDLPGSNILWQCQEWRYSDIADR
jgi:hypothetical protein